MPTTADVLIRILGNSTGLNRELKKSSGDVRGFARDVQQSTRQISAFGNVVQGIFQGIGQAAFGALVNGTRQAIGSINEAVNKASDLNETLARTNQVYKENAAEVIAWSQTTSRSLGVSQEAALSATGTLGNMFLQLGYTGDKAADFSRSLVESAADIVAFHNVAEGVPSVLNDIQSAFRGEYDPIQKYIPLINAATVEQQALAETGKKTAKELTAAEKAAAAYTLIVQGMGEATGAAARELDSAASQQRIFAARTEEAAARVGQAFLPIRQAWFSGLNELFEVAAPYGENIIRSLVSGMADGIVYLLPVLAQLRGVFVRLLKPGSPPKLLPELTEWGKGAMRAYLEGWSDPDLGALQSLGNSIESVLRSFASTGRLKETDLVARIFGSERSLVNAINEWRSAGMVSVATLDAIRRAAGPAGDSVGDLVATYFDMQQAANRASDAQRQLEQVTRRYDAALSPLQRKLDALQGKQQEIRDNQRLEALGEIIRDPRAEASERQLARLEIEEIQLRRQVDAIESERDAAIDAEQQKADAIEAERQIKERAYKQQQAILEQQTESNRLLAEEIALRERMASEALAKEEEARRKAEEAARKEAAEVQRIADAQLRYRLATTDTAGQLEILRGELAKVTEGSADYYDILTQIANLEERLGKESAGRGSVLPALAESMGEFVEESEKWPEIVKMEEALAQFFATLKGEENEVEELTWGQGILDFFTEAGRLAREAQPTIQGFIDLVTGKEVQGLPTETDPFADNWWLSGFIPAINGIIGNIALIRDKGWKEAWDGLVEQARDQLQQRLVEGDTEGAWIWEQLVEVAELIRAFAEGDWATVWDLLLEPPRELIQGVIDKINEMLNFEEQIQRFMERWGFPTNPFNNSGPGNPATPGQDPLPFNPNASFPGIAPSAPLALAGATNNNQSNVYYIEQNIGANGDFGGARQGAIEGIRQALVDRRLQGA